MASPEEFRIAVPGGEVEASLEGPPDSTSLVVLAHGAGAGKDHPFMGSFAAGLAAAGLRVARFNFLYTTIGKKAPDRQPVLEETYRAVVDDLRSRESPRLLFIGGKSMGGRIASHIAAGEDPVETDGLIFLGYPLHPPGKPDRIRDQHLAEITAPMLFVEGTRDPFCPLETLRKALEKVSAPTEVTVIDGGDHSFKVPKSSGRSNAAALEEVVEAVAHWIELF